jgi:hypothetical protein
MVRLMQCAGGEFVTRSVAALALDGKGRRV